MEAEQARQRFSTATVARMATVGPGATPHLVPIVFALIDENTVVSAVDHKRKRTTALRRLANIAQNPAVALLADGYGDDWDTLWWARADGHARVVASDQEPNLRIVAIDALVSRYVQYAQRRPSGDLIVIEVQRWSGWKA